MPWNEPGNGNGNDRPDPWRNRGAKGPPDLDEVLRNLQERLRGIVGGPRRGGGGSGDGGGGGDTLGPSFAGAFGFLPVVLALIWAATGFYIIDEGTRGVVLRFGGHVDTTSPGLHWRIPWPVDKVEVVDVERRRFVEIGYRSGAAQGQGSVPREALMITEDENIVDVRVAVQYQITDPAMYLFNVRDADMVLKQAAESAMRESVGKSRMDFVLTEGRADIVARAKDLMQQVLDGYKAGLIVQSVNLQDVQPPDEVQDAFADAIKAREDEQRQKNEAESYANEVVPKARGEAARLIEDANGYRARVVAQAEGEAQRFMKLHAEYQKAPEVTRQRLYIESMEQVLDASRKVIADTTRGNTVLYLPLDRTSAEAPSATQPPPIVLTPPSASPAQSPERRREDQRSRRSTP